MNAATISIGGEIDAHITKSGSPNNRWYVGITSNVQERLFGYHNVPRQNAWWIYRQCTSAAEARALETAYHQAGCQGAGGGGDEDSVYIYAYVITPTTVE